MTKGNSLTIAPDRLRLAAPDAGVTTNLPRWKHPMQEHRFVALWERLGGGPRAAAQIFAELQERYCAPERHYHTPRHINHCLHQLDTARCEIARPDQVELALWFHDVIYRAKGKDNEHRSAQLFLTLGTDLNRCTRQCVAELIMATVHPNEPRHPDQQAVVDIDLSSFGQSWPEFLRDSRDVRAEFAHLSHDLFMSGQGAFLNQLLAREHFYLTEFFHRRFEDQARANIRRYLELMRANLTVH